jgi:DNA primase
LPDGALKRQLLAEIADLVQLAGRELTDLWMPKPAAGAGTKNGRYAAGKYHGGDSPSNSFEGINYDISSYSSNADEGYRPKSLSKFAQKPRLGLRALPASRADHATRLLLGNMATWDSLSGEDHAMLCEQPTPHGPLFVWLESQVHEHGPQPWGALREGLRGHESEDLAVRLMSGPQLDESAEADETARIAESVQELRSLLNRMLVERLKAQETEAIEAAKADPSALARYRDLQARRRELEAATAAGLVKSN